MPVVTRFGSTAAAARGGIDIPAPASQSVTLANGLKLILVPRHDVPLVAFSAVLRGGSRLDPGNLEGVASLTAELLTRGAGARDADAFADTVEGAGGNMQAQARTEWTIASGQFLARDTGLMIKLLADALLRPHFDDTEFGQLRQRRIELLKANKDAQPNSLLGAYARALVFAGHPYGRPASGSEASLARIKRADVLAYYHDHYGADRLTLVIAGDFEPQQTIAAVREAFGDWSRAPVALPALPAPQRPPGGRVLLVDAPGATQTYFWLGTIGVDRNFPARAALNLVNTEFGGGTLVSMLNTELREKTGLTYGAYSYFARGSVAGEFGISSFTKTENTAAAVQLALDTLAKLRGAGVAAADIDSTRSYMLGQFPLVFETAAEWAGALADLELFNRPLTDITAYASDLQKVD
ncbi:MAG TPA: pitrilysin family protein, partial [Steroidobacteraceae bacterium]